MGGVVSESTFRIVIPVILIAILAIFMYQRAKDKETDENLEEKLEEEERQKRALARKVMAEEARLKREASDNSEAVSDDDSGENAI